VENKKHRQEFYEGNPALKWVVGRHRRGNRRGGWCIVPRDRCRRPDGVDRGQRSNCHGVPPDRDPANNLQIGDGQFAMEDQVGLYCMNVQGS